MKNAPATRAEGGNAVRFHATPRSLTTLQQFTYPLY